MIPSPFPGLADLTEHRVLVGGVGCGQVGQTRELGVELGANYGFLIGELSAARGERG